MEQAEATPDEVLAVGVCGQMHATVPLNKDGELLSHGVQLWCDKRSADLVDEFKAGPHVEAAMRLAGSPPVPNWLGFNIKWLKVNDPDLYEKTWKFVLSKDYINYRLTGEMATDWSEASGSFLMDAKTKTWAPELAGYLELDMDKLPDVRASSDVLGKITAEAADLTGLSEGTPVVVGAGDMLCMLISSGLTEPGRASDITHSVHHGRVCGGTGLGPAPDEPAPRYARLDTVRHQRLGRRRAEVVQRRAMPGGDSGS
jgi:xylulokinase